MSSGAGTPNHLPSAEEDELEALMRETSPPLDFDNTNNRPAGAIADGNGSCASESLNSEPASGLVRNELALARRLASQRNLHPYQRQRLEELVKVSISHLVVIFNHGLNMH